MTQDPTFPWGPEKVLTEWVEANLTNSLWKGALHAARDVSVVPLTFIVKLTHRLKFNVSRVTTYRIICDGLETVEGIIDAIECFHQMAGELTEESVTKGEQAGWFLGELLRILRVPFLNILPQTLDTAALRSRSVSVIHPWIAADSMRPSNTTQLRCPSIPPTLHAYSSCEVKFAWRRSYGRTQSIKLNRYGSYILCRFILVDAYSSGNCTRSFITMGLRDEACGLTSSRTL